MKTKMLIIIAIALLSCESAYKFDYIEKHDYLFTVTNTKSTVPFNGKFYMKGIYQFTVKNITQNQADSIVLSKTKTVEINLNDTLYITLSKCTLQRLINQ